MRILYDSKKPEYKTPFGVLAPKEVCTIRIYLPRDLQTSLAVLVLEREDGTPCAEHPFAWERDAGDYAVFRCNFSVADRGLYFYWFRITCKTGTFRLFKQGNDTNMEAGDKWQLSVIEDAHRPAAAFAGKVMYQIFPDRFCKAGDCDLRDKMQPYVLRDDWYGQPQWQPNERGEVLCNDFFGGNFRGIASKLDYLLTLGVGVIYLNPISFAFSNHRYDTSDYRRPDPMLGTEEDFSVLCRQAHRRGIKVILDGVYSHTGADSIYFDRYGTFGTGAVSRGADSPYYDWYSFRRFPDDYECWWNFKTLPNVNELSPSYLDYIIDNEDSVIARWLKLGADGFRLDVADELPDAFILRLKQRLSTLNPDALLLGEVWEDASNKCAYGVRRRYFVDNELDSVMNYPWQTAIINFVRGFDDGSALAERIMTVAENYPKRVLDCLMNLLGTHDTPRILTALAGDFDGDRAAQSKVTLSPQQRAAAVSKLHLAAFLQFALPGCPCIYYGDEAGMEGCKDPFNRACFPWGREDESLTAYYQRLGQLKNTASALRTGTVEVVDCGGGRLSFLRTDEAQTVLCCVNCADTPWRVQAGTVLFAEHTEENGETLTLQPQGCAAILLKGACR